MNQNPVWNNTTKRYYLYVVSSPVGLLYTARRMVNLYYRSMDSALMNRKKRLFLMDIDDSPSRFL